MRFALFGAGYVGKILLDELGEEHVACFVDNKKSGQQCEGKAVISLDTYIADYSGTRIVVTSFDYADEMVAQLVGRGITDYYVCDRAFEDLLWDSKPYLPRFFDNGQWIPYPFSRSFLIRNFSSLSNITIYCYAEIKELFIELVKLCGLEEEFKNWIIYGDEENALYEELGDDSDCLLVAVSREDNMLCERYEHDGAIGIVDLYDIMPLIDKLHCPQIKKYRNTFKGKRCFLIGNGPSLKMNDLDILHKSGEITFGCNRIYLAFDNTKWRPDYYCVSDNAAYIGIPWDMLPEKTICFIASKLKGDDASANGNETSWFHYREERYGKNKPRFSQDISICMYTGYTVLYDIMFQSAMFMGFDEIYLLGVDHDFSNTLERFSGEGAQIIHVEDEDHFIKGYLKPGDKFNTPNMEGAHRAFERANEEADKRGIRIYNATRGGKLEVFERVDFDGLWRQE